ncbi:STAS domain-containing protein [Luteimicrobium album]|uniref:STAS domain-containing protein n=1 Tax=Luteimicrobium album TaxID=1054550 RepID=UPI0024E08205|nr:STAS domain-containing protein [Luteimicrobium album]
MHEQNNRTDPAGEPDGTSVDVADELADASIDEVAGAERDPGDVGVIVGSQRVRIVLAGEIDIDLEHDLRDAIGDAEGTGLPIEIDAHHVTFIDSSGVSFLAELASRANPPVRVLRAPEHEVPAHRDPPRRARGARRRGPRPRLAVMSRELVSRVIGGWLPIAEWGLW